jgi:hypothetical protein
MKIMHSLVIALALAAAGCATQGVRMTGSGRPHGGGADVPVWVDSGNLSIGEEPIHRQANSNAPVIFTLDHDRETDQYKFPANAVVFVPPTGEYTCATISDTLVKCDHTGTAPGPLKYQISVVSRSTGLPLPPLDPFIIVH